MTTRNRGFSPPTLRSHPLQSTMMETTQISFTWWTDEQPPQTLDYCLAAERSKPLTYTRLNLDAPDSRPQSGEFHIQDVREETKLQEQKVTSNLQGLGEELAAKGKRKLEE